MTKNNSQGFIFVIVSRQRGYDALCVHPTKTGHPEAVGQILQVSDLNPIQNMPRFCRADLG